MESVCGWAGVCGKYGTVHTPAGYVIEGNTGDYVVQVSKPKRRSGLMV